MEYLSLGGIGPGVPVRATVSDFGPLLLAKVLEANKVQEQSLQLVFHYADEKGLPLLDLSDLRALLTFLESDAGKDELKGIGGLASSTVGVLLRALVGLETGGGEEFFGEPQFEIADLMRTAADGRGVISCLELPAVQDRPKLFSTVLMWLLAELFEQLPEAGDLDKPKLVFFFDEAHLLFDEATDAFLDSVVQTVRLIRSKGVGVFFVTQVPDDVPGEVLGQLGSRVQHALRAFTPDDARALKAAASTYPRSDFYDVEELLTSMGIGEAAVTLLSEDGVPTPVVHTRLRAPASRMGPADDVEAAAKASPLFAKYGERAEAESAREKLAARMEQAPAEAEGAGREGSTPAEDARRISKRRRKQAATATGGGVGRARRLPALARGQGAGAQGGARGVRDAAQEPVSAPAASVQPSATSRCGPRSASSWPPSCAHTPPSGRPRAGFRTRCSRAWASGVCWGSSTRASWAGAAATTSTTRCWPRSCRARARAAWPPGSARTCRSPRRRSGSSGPTTRSSASSPPPSAASGSRRSGSPSPAPAPTWPASAPWRKRVDGGYLVNGSKTYITNGVRADFVVTAVKTTEAGGHQGLSFLIIEREAEGFSVSKKLEKLGWHASDTGELAFADVFVPEENLLGEENRGFYLIMANFQWERLVMALGAVSSMDRVLERVVAGAAGHSRHRHAVAEMALRHEASRSLTYHALRLFADGHDAIREVTQAKLLSQRAAFEVAELAYRVTDGDEEIARAMRDTRLGPDRRRLRRGDEGDPEQAAGALRPALSSASGRARRSSAGPRPRDRAPCRPPRRCETAR